MLVKIVRLPVIRAISFHSRNSKNPETEAREDLLNYMTENSLADQPLLHQVFGRNNPISLNNPENRGYEFLLTVTPEFQAGNDYPVTYINDQLYAVVSSKGLKQMQDNWNLLIEWIQESQEYTFDYPGGFDFNLSPSLELEHHITPFDTNEKTVLIDYYFPIKKKEQ
jgi:predicted transcriptional regulator YdeE